MAPLESHKTGFMGSIFGHLWGADPKIQICFETMFAFTRYLLNGAAAVVAANSIHASRTTKLQVWNFLSSAMITCRRVCMYVCMYVFIYVCMWNFLSSAMIPCRRVCMYVCVSVLCMYYVCMYVYMYVCMYVVCMYVVFIMYVCTYVCCMYVCIYVCMHVCMSNSLSIAMTTCRRVCMCVCMYVYMYVHTITCRRAHAHEYLVGESHVSEGKKYYPPTLIYSRTY